MKQPLNEQFIRMQKLAGIINENKVTFQSRLNEGSDTYPFQADPEVIVLYDKIANELEGTISIVANKLEIPESDIRICLDYLYDDLQGNKAKKRGMFIQVKTDDAKWDEAWTGNPLIMQTTNDEGIVIPSNPFFGVSIKGNKNPKVRAIYNKALDLDLEALAASENTKIADLVSPEEMKLIAPNTPIVVTGKSNINENQIQEMDVKTILDNNGIDDDYFESMGEKSIELGSNEWMGALSDLVSKDAYTAKFDEEDNAKIQAFMQKLEALGIELI